MQVRSGDGKSKCKTVTNNQVKFIKTQPCVLCLAFTTLSSLTERNCPKFAVTNFPVLHHAGCLCLVICSMCCPKPGSSTCCAKFSQQTELRCLFYSSAAHTQKRCKVVTGELKTTAKKNYSKVDECSHCQPHFTPENRTLICRQLLPLVEVSLELSRLDAPHPATPEVNLGF